MVILGCDSSTHTGWVVQEYKCNVLTKLGHGEIVAPKGCTGVYRAAHIGERIKKLSDRYKTQVVAMEGYGYANKHTLVPLVEIGTSIRLALIKTQLFVDIPPTSLKKFVSGSGVSKKDKMMLDVYKRWGFQGTDNEVDAYALTMFIVNLVYYNKGVPSNGNAVNSWMATGAVENKLRLVARINELYNYN